MSSRTMRASPLSRMPARARRSVSAEGGWRGLRLAMPGLILASELGMSEHRRLAST
jgi:hypothetical protein